MAVNKDDLSVISEENDRSHTFGYKLNQALRAYATVSHITFIILTPILIFVVGGTWAVKEFSLPGVFNIIFIVIGILSMIASFISYLYKLMLIYGKDKRGSDPAGKYKTDSKDYDY